MVLDEFRVSDRSSNLARHKEAKVRPLGEYRWFGDYKFGTFIADSASEWRPRYFVPWSQTKYGAPGYSAQLYGAVWTL